MAARAKSSQMDLSYQCFYCFDVVASKLNGTDHAEPNFENDDYPLFVSWHLVRKEKRILKGCIGNFSSLPLHSGLRDYALIRFKPIELKDLAFVECSVSLLVNFEVAKNYLDWEIGIHGIRIEFKDHNGRRKTATYLPEIALEQGWTKDEAIDSLLRKGGYLGTADTKFKETIVLTRYKSQKHSVSYADFMKWKGT
ncbi:AMME chromosomal region protein 1-like [Irineochytrium annulatum]|nr:AMME chromosomal region protein 1-like [Irineochytrium annulatum]